MGRDCGRSNSSSGVIYSPEADPTSAHQQVFLNIVLDEAVEEKAGGEKVRIGMVVCPPLFPFPFSPSPPHKTPRHSPHAPRLTSRDAQVIRGNSVVMLEALERIGGGDRGGGDHRERG